MKTAKPGQQNQGDKYREGVEKAAQNSEQLGEAAKKAPEGPEGEALRKADERGKRADVPDAAKKTAKR